MKLTYSRVAWTWAVGFVLFGAAFLLLPEAVGDGLTFVAGLFGLEGTVETGGRDMYWVLAMSTMTTVTVLAVWSARQPHNDAAFVALMTSKLTSTTLFVVLAIAAGPAWLVCAAGDGFVALSLWAARRREKKAWSVAA